MKTALDKRFRVRALAALHGTSLSALASGAPCHTSLFYRVLRGEKTSARVDRYLARRLGVTVRMIRGEAA